ncbi:MAG: HIT domain-containing protein [Candidatus Omnitrophica bacterium]|nr:HIT domain-containing protein [Candidatus Omnitrophota bacterium]
MEKLWAPWREKYLYGQKEKKCVFCIEKKKDKSYDKKHLIIYRGKYCFSILNKYPYNNGHIMVVPYRHINAIEKLADKEILEMFKIIKRTKEILDDKLHPGGYNIGMNLGRTAGAGITGHIHIHIVPRWDGDANFMAILGNTRVISQSLNALYDIMVKSL